MCYSSNYSSEHRRGSSLWFASQDIRCLQVVHSLSRKIIMIHLIFEHIESDKHLPWGWRANDFGGVNEVRSTSSRNQDDTSEQMQRTSNGKMWVLTRVEKNYYDESRANKNPEGHNVSYRGCVNRSCVCKNVLTRIVLVYSLMWLNSTIRGVLDGSSVSCSPPINQFNRSTLLRNGKFLLMCIDHWVSELDMV